MNREELLLMTQMSPRLAVINPPKKTREQECEELAQHIEGVLSEEELYRFGYIPFVIAGLVWDYAETVTDMCASLRLDALKHMCREIKNLRREYEQERIRTRLVKLMQHEEHNAMIFEEDIKKNMRLFLTHLRIDVDKTYPDRSDDERFLIIAIHQCIVVLDSLIENVREMCENVSNRLGVRLGTILPPTLEPLRESLKKAEDIYRLPDGFYKTKKIFSHSFANMIKAIPLTDEKPVAV